jgi:hypothetical protein
MPDLPCPVGDYVARGATLAAAASSLSEHLVKQHCDQPTEDPVSPENLEEPANA